IPGINLPGVVDSTTLLSLTTLPKHLIVIGGGYIGLEWATIFNTLGSRVSIVEFMPTLLPSADEDISKRMSVFAKRDGIGLYLSTSVTSIEKIDGSLRVSINNPTTASLDGDCVLVATGRKPNIEMLGLNQVKVDYSASGIRVNNVLQTSVESIYAIGDCIGAPMLAHKATFQAKQVIAHITHHRFEPDFGAIPSVVFSFPEIASVGLTEAEVVLKGIIYETKRIPLRSNGKAVANGETDGFLKVILDSDKKLLGAHVICAQANALISELALLYHLGKPLTEYVGFIHVHPTLSEIIQTLIQSL
ncbi:MAG: NAD(P)/FAD-dependent oxidoreductase, partial [Firmicutes bacterium]|nr:NAD(P)/FAD-dependent oxidoreductase [Bacillota bacterium]